MSETTEPKKPLIAALLRFHQSVGRIPKNQAADRYRYADLAGVLEVIRLPLLEAGLTLTQSFDGSDLLTTLWHLSGDSIQSRLTVPTVELRGMNPCQALGSAISYCRRYAILSLLALSTEDDDGAAARPAPPSPAGAPF